LPSSCGIDSIANPHLNDDSGTIIVKHSGLCRG
jgi:hypothetical protein